MSAASAASAVSPPITRVLVSAERIQRWLPWLAGALTLVAAIHAIEPLPIGVFYDDAQYVVLAKSLATGHGYRFLNLPGEPIGTHFPPGYPAFLALLWWISPSFPENVALFKFANAILLAIVAFFSYRFANRTLGVPRALSLLAAICGSATIPSLVLSSAIMSEPLFLALLLPLVAWAEEETRVARLPTRRALAAAVLIGLAAGLLALVRTHGVALVAALVAAYGTRRRWREAITCLVASAIVLAPWMATVALHNDALPPLVRGAYGSYIAWFTTGLRAGGVHLLAVTLPDNVATLWMSLVRSIAPDIHWSLDLLVGAIYLVFCAFGVPTWWRRARVMLLFIAGYLAVVLVWPFSPLRFVWGIWPLLMLLPVAGIVTLWRGHIVRRAAAGPAVLIGASAALLLGIASFNARGYSNAWWSSNARFHARRVLPQLAWVARSTQPRDLVAADAEAAVYLYTGRHAVPITTFTAVEYARERTVGEQMTVIDQLLDQYKPRYVLATSPHVVAAMERLAHSRSRSVVRIDSLSQGEVYAHFACTSLAGHQDPLRCE